MVAADGPAPRSRAQLHGTGRPVSRSATCALKASGGTPRTAPQRNCRLIGSKRAGAGAQNQQQPMRATHRRASPISLFSWVLRDSNPRHSPCKGDALPAELSTRAANNLAGACADGKSRYGGCPTPQNRSLGTCDPGGGGGLRRMREITAQLDITADHPLEGELRDGRACALADLWPATARPDTLAHRLDERALVRGCAQEPIAA